MRPEIQQLEGRAQRYGFRIERMWTDGGCETVFVKRNGEVFAAWSSAGTRGSTGWSKAVNWCLGIGESDD